MTRAKLFSKAHIPTAEKIMETKTAYLTRRARQERANAADAGSAEARAAHLELAVRLVKAATTPALWRAWSADSEDPAIAREPIDKSGGKVDYGLAVAFPAPSTTAFDHLLDRID